MRAFGFGFLSAVVCLPLVAVAILLFGWVDFRADQTVPAWQQKLQETFIRASVRRGARGVTAPLPASNENLIAGGKLYLNDCIGCHGKPGEASTYGVTFTPKAPQFAEVETGLSEAQMYWVAKHGIRRTGMFSQGEYPDASLWKLVQFIHRARSLPPEVSSELKWGAAK